MQALRQVARNHARLEPPAGQPHVPIRTQQIERRRSDPRAAQLRCVVGVGGHGVQPQPTQGRQGSQRTELCTGRRPLAEQQQVQVQVGQRIEQVFDRAVGPQPQRSVRR